MVLGFVYQAGMGGTIKAPAVDKRFKFSRWIKLKGDSLGEMINGLFSFRWTSAHLSIKSKEKPEAYSS